MNTQTPRVLIVGGGFGGLNAAHELGRAGFPVTLLDRTNYHLFQPLLYQVATGFLGTGDITAPLRSALARFPSVEVFQAEVTDIDPSAKMVITEERSFPYDILIVATGMTHSYFGHDEWALEAPGLKTIEDAVTIRARVLHAFEAAERCNDPERRRAFMTFAIVGAGPTGIELAGAIAELAQRTLRGEFRSINPADARILLFEGGDRPLSNLHPTLSGYAQKTLERIRVSVRTNTRVTCVERGAVTVQGADGATERIEAETIVWAAGVRANPLAEVLEKRAGALRDRSGRVEVSAQLHLANDSTLFVIGDLACVKGKNGSPLPGVAPVAMQQGRYVAQLLKARARGAALKPFRYFDKGNMAVIGKGRAVAESGPLRLTGFPAWLAWAFIHIYFLIEFENKLLVFIQWAWNFLTNKRGSRIITSRR